MKNTFKEIHIGQLIEIKCKESEIVMERMCRYFKCNNEEIIKMFNQKDLSTDLLLKWSKLLEYDFFRIYSQQLILFAPPGSRNYNTVNKTKKTALPTFRKNIYTKEIIDYILELISSGKKDRKQVMEEYNIPKTTLYKWITKYSK
ncbi:helix-turn-helix domain-containing protein [Chryseobacterium arthrosphaerae]|uniref:helix-turn-helix domain-containing protein n=1 Tax=Chryseobacterium arthrosphaerae TaxID=651561 RepID=UPI001F4B3AFB|nr:helix-turn-helix domain-containing protein [Chryseobacterium arthrosphaerae]MDG4654302.1 helix-turn-helix domain-containing protein [Chryseobacterium arthrosphaerae]